MTRARNEHQAARRRAVLVDQLLTTATVDSAAIEAALRAVPRHRFIPEVSLREAYADEAVVIKRGADGLAMSSLSQPTMVAIMLDQLDVHPGHRVLEIGAGTGYNAALLSHIVGDNGQVTTIEFDPGVADRARLTLGALDPRVHVVTGDGEVGFPDRAPFDRIIATVGAWDIAPAWWDQLRADGLLVAPLRLGGLQRSIGFRPVDSRHWRSTSIQSCGFVPMQGAGAFEARTLRLASDVALHVDDQVAIAPGLSQALDFPPAVEWTGVHSGGRDVYGDLELWLLTAVHALGRLGVNGADLVAPVPIWGAVTVIAGDSLAYLTRRPAGAGTEFGVAAYGPAAADLALGVAAEVQAFARATRAGVRPLIDAHRIDPSGTSTNSGGTSTDSGGTLAKRHTRLDIEWMRAQPG